VLTSDSSGCAAICAQTSRVAASSFSSEVSRHTSPDSSASRAEIQLEVRNAWVARWRPISAGRVTVLPASGRGPAR